MAPTLRKRVIRKEDIADAQRLLDVLNPLHEAVYTALTGGLTLANVKHVLLDMVVTPPSEWTPLELLNSASVWNPGLGVPACRWTPSGTQYRGIVKRAQSGTSFFTAFARIPEAVKTLRPSTPLAGLPATANYTAGCIDVGVDGSLFLTAPSSFTANGFVSLVGLLHPSTPVPPPWAVPQEADLRGPGGVDYGTPSFVFCLGATREDRRPTNPDFLPEWETPLVGLGRAEKRVFRLKYLGGLEAGVEHRVQLLCLYP